MEKRFQLFWKESRKENVRCPVLYFAIYVLIGSWIWGAPAHADRCKDTSKKVFDLTDFPEEYPASIREQRDLIHFLKGSAFLEDATSYCRDQPQFLVSMEQLERSVALVAARSTLALGAIRELNGALLQWVRIAALLQSKIKKTIPEVEVNSILSEVFGRCDHTFPGCVGSDPKKIRASFREGNLREQFYLSWNPAISFMNKYLYCTDPSVVCLCKGRSSKVVDFLYQHVEEPGMGPILQLCDDWVNGQAPGDRGRFAAANRYFRDEIPKNEKPEADDHWGLVIPLSEREMAVPGAGPAVWNAGAKNFRPVDFSPELSFITNFPDPDHLYYQTARRFNFPTMVAMSGSTDSILNLACILEMDEKEYPALLLAAIGYMVPHLHHSIYEILVAARSFQPFVNIPLTPDYYKNLIADPEFAREVETDYKEMGTPKLPTEIYRDCLESYLMNFGSEGECLQEPSKVVQSMDELLRLIDAELENMESEKQAL